MRKSISLYKPDVRELITWELYHTSQKIGDKTFYNLVDGNVGIRCDDGTCRWIKSNWFDDEQFEEPTDEAIEAIALEALAEGLQKSNPLAMIYARNIPVQFFLIDPFFKTE